jgi:subtilisin family serine protease
MPFPMPKKEYRCFIFLILLIVLCGNPLPCQGSAISSNLQAAIRFHTENEEVPIIINLSDRVNIHSFQDPDKNLRRAKIIRTLRDHADLSQGSLKKFLEKKKVRKISSLWLSNRIAATVPARMIPELDTFPGVESITLDQAIQVPPTIISAAAFPEWNINALQAPFLWNLGFTGTGVVVANLDSGVDLNHPDLQSKWRGGTNGWYDPFGQHANPNDLDGHGTGTMGIMVGGSSGGTAIGLAPGARWIAAKIFDDAGNSSLSVAHQAFQWLLNPDRDGFTADAPDVVNASLFLGNSMGTCISDFQTDIQTLRAAGIAVVFAAGNSGPGAGTSESPANNPGAISVGAADSFNNIASFSSRGPSACDGGIFPSVVAPGIGVKTADLTFGGIFPNSYMTVSGTSFSAPHAAGALALLMSAFPHDTPNDLQLLELALKQSARDLGDFGSDNVYGYGLIDVQGAYELLLNPGPVIVASPMSQNFGKIQIDILSSAREFTLLNKGLTDLVIGAASIGGADAPQFSKQGDTCSGQTLAPSISCQVHVVFAPGSIGAKNAILIISSNDPATPNLSVPLNGIASLPTTKLGIFRQGAWYLDFNGNGFWDGCGTDTCFGSFGGFPTDRPITGNWNGMGAMEVGIYRNGSWYLDANGNGAWDGCGTDRCFPSFGGLLEDLPITGDWDGSGRTKIGIYRNGAWYLDRNGNGRWDGCGTTADTDICFPSFGGLAEDIPVGGDWTGDGRSKIGIYRNGAWYLDRNGNGRWDGCGTTTDTDICFTGFGGLNIDVPVAGDWTGDGITKIGIYRNGAWYLDRNGNGQWDGCGTSPDADICPPAFGGFPEDKPISGKW